MDMVVFLNDKTGSILATYPNRGFALEHGDMVIINGISYKVVRKCLDLSCCAFSVFLQEDAKVTYEFV